MQSNVLVAGSSLLLYFNYFKGSAVCQPDLFCLLRLENSGGCLSCMRCLSFTWRFSPSALSHSSQQSSVSPMRQRVQARRARVAIAVAIPSHAPLLPVLESIDQSQTTHLRNIFRVPFRFLSIPVKYLLFPVSSLTRVAHHNMAHRHAILVLLLNVLACMTSSSGTEVGSLTATWSSSSATTISSGKKYGQLFQGLTLPSKTVFRLPDPRRQPRIVFLSMLLSCSKDGE